MFIAGAYHPDTPISSAIFPMLSPNAVAMSLFHVLAIMTADGNPTEPVPVKLLLMDAGTVAVDGLYLADAGYSYGLVSAESDELIHIAYGHLIQKLIPLSVVIVDAAADLQAQVRCQRLLSASHLYRHGNLPDHSFRC